MSEIDSSILTALGRIEAGQTHTADTIQEIRSEQREHAASLRRVETGVAALDERLEGHMREDDRRFSEVGEDITRAHRKISDGSKITHFGDPVPRQTDGLSTGQKTGMGAGIVAALGVVITALANWLKGGGGNTP